MKQQGLVEIQDSDSSGILYSLAPNPDPRFAGKGKKYGVNSTYAIETHTGGDQPIATQRSNGLVEGSGKPVASGILCNGVSFHRFMDGYIATNANAEDQINLQPHGDGNWEVSYWQGAKQHGVQAICSLEEGLRLGASMLQK